MEENEKINTEKKPVEKTGMINKLIDIKELVAILGYADQRSIEAWCKKNKVPLFHIGKKTYTISDFIDLFITQKLEEYVKATYKNPDEILKAINEDNKVEFSKLVNAPLDKTTLIKFKQKENSKAADDFMKKLKKAA
jgi:hypothetical protein